MGKSKPHDDPRCFCAACGEWHMGLLAEQARASILKMLKGAVVHGLISIDTEIGLEPLKVDDGLPL